jgi:hypothetical protein
MRPCRKGRQTERVPDRQPPERTSENHPSASARECGQMASPATIPPPWRAFAMKLATKRWSHSGLRDVDRLERRVVHQSSLTPSIPVFGSWMSAAERWEDPAGRPRPPSAMARPDGAGGWALSEAAGGRGTSRGEARSEGSGAALPTLSPAIRAQWGPCSWAARPEAVCQRRWAVTGSVPQPGAAKASPPSPALAVGPCPLP